MSNFWNGRPRWMKKWRRKGRMGIHNNIPPAPLTCLLFFMTFHMTCLLKGLLRKVVLILHSLFLDRRRTIHYYKIAFRGSHFPPPKVGIGGVFNITGSFWNPPIVSTSKIPTFLGVDFEEIWTSSKMSLFGVVPNHHKKVTLWRWFISLQNNAPQKVGILEAEEIRGV